MGDCTNRIWPCRAGIDAGSRSSPDSRCACAAIIKNIIGRLSSTNGAAPVRHGSYNGRKQRGFYCTGEVPVDPTTDISFMAYG